MILFKIKVAMETLELKARVRSLIEAEKLPYETEKGKYVIYATFKAIDMGFDDRWADRLIINVEYVDPHTSYLEIDPKIYPLRITGAAVPKENEIEKIDRLVELVLQSVKERVEQKKFSVPIWGASLGLAIIGIAAFIKLIVFSNGDDPSLWEFLILGAVLPGCYCLRDLGYRVVGDLSEKMHWIIYLLFIPIFGSILYYREVIKAGNGPLD